MSTSTKEESVKKGQKVQAKWPGSSLYIEAKVLKKSGKFVDVEFEDGTVETVKISSLRTATKRQTRSRSRSPGRGRTGSASRSPQRKPKAIKPEKSSPKVTKSSPKEAKPSPKETKPSTKEAKSSTKEAKSSTKEVKSSTKEVKSSTKDAKSSTKEAKASPKEIKTRSKTNSFGRSTTPSSKTADVVSMSTNSKSDKVLYSEITEKEFKTYKNETSSRTSARIAALQMEKAARSSPYRESRKLRSSSSDEDEESEDEADGPTKKPPVKAFYFGSFTFALLKVLVLPMFILYLCLACAKYKCSIYVRPPVYNRWQEFASDIKLPLLVTSLFHLSLVILSKIPLGRVVAGFEELPKEKLPRKYRLNGIFLLLLAIASFGGAFYFKVNLNWGYDKIKPIVISSVIYSFVWSLAVHAYGLFMKQDLSERRPQHRAGFLGDFYYGLQVNPWVFGREDVKTRVIQFGLISMVLLDMSILTKFLLKESFSMPLALTTVMHLIFVLDYFCREEHMLSTATYTDDGVGYGFIMGIGTILPCSFVLQTAFLFNESSKASHLPHWCSAAIALLFVIGLYIYNASSRLKHNFRKNPFLPSLSYVNSIPTSKKKRLITSGLFRYIRHPNYLGLIMMVTAASMPCGFTHILPYFPTFYVVQLLLLRIWKIERSCQEKYGPAWQNYKNTVPKRLIPFVF